MTQTNWEEIKGGDLMDMWNGKDSNLQVGASVEGRLEDVKTEQGPNKSNVYVLSTDTKGEDLIGIWGSTVLDGKFQKIAVGKMVKVVFNGRKKGKRGTEYKDFSIFVGIDTPEKEVDALNL